MEQTTQISSGECGREESSFDLENSVPPKESNDDLLDQAWDDHTGQSLDTKKVQEARQLQMSITTKCTCSIKCLLLNAGRGQARRS